MNSNENSMARLQSKLRELAEVWREMEKPNERSVMSSHDCADDLDALLDAFNSEATP